MLDFIVRPLRSVLGVAEQDLIAGQLDGEQLSEMYINAVSTSMSRRAQPALAP